MEQVLTMYLGRYDEATRNACFGKWLLKDIPEIVAKPFMRLRDEWQPAEPVNSGTLVRFQWKDASGVPMEFEARRRVHKGAKCTKDFTNNVGGWNYWTIAVRKAENFKAERKEPYYYSSLSWTFQRVSFNHIPTQVRTKQEVTEIANSVKAMFTPNTNN